MFIRIIFFICMTLLTCISSLLSQPFVDTIYSGRTPYVDFSESISRNFSTAVSEVDFYRSKTPKYIEFKPMVPSILMRNSKKRVKSDILLKFDALIYTIYSNHGSSLHETIFMEMFYENEKLAKECIRGLQKLEKAFDIYKYKDVVESKTEMIGQLEHYNCYYTRKGNIVYFIYNMIPDTKEYPITAIMKKKLHEIID